MGLKRSAAAVLGALVLLAIAGATSSGASSTSTTLAGQGGVKILDSGTVTFAVSRLPTQFNPLTPGGSNSITQMVMEQVLPQLFVTGPGMQIHAVDGLVTSAEVTGLKPQTVVYTLAKGARWSDGVAISASDFAYNWHALMRIGRNLPATFPLAGYEDITSVTGSVSKKLGTTVKVVFAKPYADWMALFNDLVPAHIARRYGWVKAFEGRNPAHLVSGGPFVITKIVPGKELVLSRNPAFWGRRAHLDHIIFKVEHSEGATLRALRAGSVDLAELAPGANVTGVVTRSVDLEQTVSDSATLWQLAFNFADPVTGRLVMREAIAAAINRPEVVADSVGVVEPGALAPGNRIYAAGQPGGILNDSAYLAPDDAEVDLLLVAAGYVLDAEGDAACHGEAARACPHGTDGEPHGGRRRARDPGGASASRDQDADPQRAARFTSVGDPAAGALPARHRAVHRVTVSVDDGRALHRTRRPDAEPHRGRDPVRSGGRRDCELPRGDGHRAERRQRGRGNP